MTEAAIVVSVSSDKPVKKMSISKELETLKSNLQSLRKKHYEENHNKHNKLIDETMEMISTWI